MQYLDKGTIKGLLAYKLSGGLSRNTVRILHATLRALLAAAVDDGVIPANPAEKLGRQLRLVLPKAVRQEEIKAMTREQRQFFILSAAQETPGYYPLFVTLAGTGMRLGEVLALQWDDVHLEARKISVGRSRRRRGTAAPSICLRGLPTCCDRWSGNGAAHMLAREWLTMPPWVVCTRVGTPMDESKVRRAMRTVLLAAGLPQHFSPHVCGIPMRVSCCNRANP